MSRFPESFKKKRDGAANKYAALEEYPNTVWRKKGFKSGANFGYLEGRDAMAKEIVRWLKEQEIEYAPLEVQRTYYQFANEIEQWFLKK